MSYDKSVSDFAFNSNLRLYTPDNVAISIDGVLYVKIVDPKKAGSRQCPPMIGLDNWVFSMPSCGWSR
jgi:regulator of protease activity HflC (stomatin/prohibitin superfamily)